MDANLVAFLESLIKKLKIADPLKLFTSPVALNNFIRTALSEIEKQEDAKEDAKENQKFLLFQIKQTIDRSMQEKTKTISSSRQLKLGQELIIVPQTGEKYSSYVTSNLKEFLAIQAPEQESGIELRWRQGTSVVISFLAGENDRYSFSTKVLGYNTIQGVSSLFVQHSNSIKSARNRKFPRKAVERPAYFFPIQIVISGKGRKEKREAVIDAKKRLLGNLLDLSAGGCSLRTMSPLKPGELIRIDFETRKRKTISVFGKVIKVRRYPNKGGIMHIMFTKVTKAHLNAINEFVYGFTT